MKTYKMAASKHTVEWYCQCRAMTSSGWFADGHHWGEDATATGSQESVEQLRCRPGRWRRATLQPWRSPWPVHPQRDHS